MNFSFQDWVSAITVVSLLIGANTAMVKMIVRQEISSIKQSIADIGECIAKITTDLGYIKRDLDRLQTLPERVGRLEADMSRLNAIFVTKEELNHSISRIHGRIDEHMREDMQ